MWRLSPLTHCDVITVISDCVPLEVSLQLRFCKFSSNILKYVSNVVKTSATVALRNPFSVYCTKCLEITYQCVQVNINECHSLVFKNWYYSITGEMSSNLNVLKDMIDIRDGMKECTCLYILLKCFFVRNEDIIINCLYVSLKRIILSFILAHKNNRPKWHNVSH